MDRSKSANAAALVGALLAGVAIGATVGILFAPEKGSDIRKKLSEGGDGLTDDLTSKFNSLLESFKSEFEEAKNKMAEGAKTAANAANDIKKG